MRGYTSRWVPTDAPAQRYGQTVLTFQSGKGWLEVAGKALQAK
jgi:hypothetical protein